MPLSVAIIIGIFVIQQYGTHRVGGLFGPDHGGLVRRRSPCSAWCWIVRAPAVLGALDPRHAFSFFIDNGWHGFAVLGAVVLAVTGGEALYADMGHFGKRPIRMAWFVLVLPGADAQLLRPGRAAPARPARRLQPFYLLAPTWALLPLVVLATLAAIIASQALISGAFSLTRQAIQLGYAPRLDIEHTSSHEMGQVYVPQVNWALAVCTILIVIGFRIVERARRRLRHRRHDDDGDHGAAAARRDDRALEVAAAGRACVTAVFLTVDVALLGANLLKIVHGGWLPLAVARVRLHADDHMEDRAAARGRAADGARHADRGLHGRVTAAAAGARARHRGVHDRAAAGTPPALVHNLRYNKVLHEHVVILTVTHRAGAATSPREDQVTVEPLGHGIYNVRVQYGFMQDPDVPERPVARPRARPGARSGRRDVLPRPRDDHRHARPPGMAIWREKLFVLMARNAVRATAFFRLPPERVVELGVQVEM